MDFLVIFGCDTYFKSEMRQNHRVIDRDSLQMKLSALNYVVCTSSHFDPALKESYARGRHT